MSFSLTQICEAFVADCTRNHPNDAGAQERCQLNCAPDATCEELLTECVASWSDDWNRRCRDAFHCEAALTAGPPPSTVLVTSVQVTTARPPEQTTTVTNDDDDDDLPPVVSRTFSEAVETSVPISSVDTDSPASRTTAAAESSQPTAPSSTTDSTSADESIQPPPSSSDGGLSTGAKAAIGTTIPLAFILAFVVLFLLFRRRRNKREEAYHPAAAEMSNDNAVVAGAYLPPQRFGPGPFELENPPERTTPRGSVSELGVGGYNYQIERGDGRGGYPRSNLGR